MIKSKASMRNKKGYSSYEYEDDCACSYADEGYADEPEAAEADPAPSKSAAPERREPKPICAICLEFLHPDTTESTPCQVCHSHPTGDHAHRALSARSLCTCCSIGSAVSALEYT